MVSGERRRGDSFFNTDQLQGLTPAPEDYRNRVHIDNHDFNHVENLLHVLFVNLHLLRAQLQSHGDSRSNVGFNGFAYMIQTCGKLSAAVPVHDIQNVPDTFLQGKEQESATTERQAVESFSAS
ncbi:hypothetical protein [Succinimonas sp.]|uniref:hypothetical protein n=1 Tax=Succinimonas sp. TaxID=1936151 RepID=UPI0038647FFA